VAEGRVTVIDGRCRRAGRPFLNAVLGWWWADPAAGIVIIYCATKEARTIQTDLSER
jgi:hypothetical protein